MHKLNDDPVPICGKARDSDDPLPNTTTRIIILILPLCVCVCVCESGRSPEVDLTSNLRLAFP